MVHEKTAARCWGAGVLDASWTPHAYSTGRPTATAFTTCGWGSVGSPIGTEEADECEPELTMVTPLVVVTPLPGRVFGFAAAL